jgi:hypothetical protein
VRLCRVSLVKLVVSRIVTQADVSATIDVDLLPHEKSTCLRSENINIKESAIVGLKMRRC